MLHRCLRLAHRPCFSVPLLALTLFPLLTGCTTGISRQVYAENGELHKGIGYCLPMGKVTIVVEKIIGQPTQLKNDGPGAQTEAGKKKADQATPGLPPENDSTLPGDPSPPPGAAIVQASSASPEEQAEAAKKAAQQAAVGFPQEALKAIQEAAKAADKAKKEAEEAAKVAAAAKDKALAAAVEAAQPRYRIRYEKTEYVADRSKTYVVRYTPNAMADDDVKVTVEESLLKKVEVKVKDRTVDAVKKIILTAENLARFAAAVQSTGTISSVEELYRATFDPLDPAVVRQIKAHLAQLEGGPYSLSVLGKAGFGGKGGGEEYRPTADASRNGWGVVYRQAASYDLVLSRKHHTTSVTPVLLPNEGALMYWPLARSAFVERTHTLDFSHGMLTSVTTNKPSEILSGLDIPVDITASLASLPGKVVNANAEQLTALGNRDDKRLVRVTKAGALDRGLVDEEIKNLEKAEELRAKQAEIRDKLKQ